jgi:hypothetical protein
MLAQEQKSLVFVWKSQEQTSRTSEYSDNSLPSKHEEGVTSHLASQSFENFYTALFGLNSDRQNHLFDLAALAGRQRSANLTGHLQENPFAETINQLKNNPASASQASSDFPNTTQAQNSANGSPPRGKDQPGGSKSSPQPETPDSSSDLPKKPVSQFTIPGGIKPFAIVGDIKHDGRGIVIPGFRMQGNQFEIPFVGMVSLKLLVIPDPAMTTRSVAIDDLNGDGIADIALASAADPFVMIWCGLPTGEFYYLGGFGAPNGGRSITSGDFNGDGKMDLALLQPADDQNVDILLGDGTGRFNYATTVRFASSIDMLYASDITSGHNRDLLGTNLVYYRSFLLASSGNATLLKRTEFSFANIPTVLLFSDLNLDGRLEELFLFQDRQQLSVVLNPTRPLIMQHIANYNLKYPVFLVIGDLFGMGAIDLGIAPIPK